ncbi:MAG: N-acetyl sugar amidotransferase [Bacteroidia bacterium]|nr:N-acetyl sugar amidotransferase [Bacteroidia bacterium]
MNLNYKICTRCIMDTTDSNITFSTLGVCNHCLNYDEQKKLRVWDGTQAKIELEKIVNKIKKTGLNNTYDCIIGVSGGVDSTYVAYVVKQLGLRPLAIHFDNNWNSELAVSNIEKTLTTLDIDLYTYVIDWPEFKDLQLSFLKASTPDGEVPSDHAINALLYKEANKRGIKYIINGMNYASESIAVHSWAYGHTDWKYINGVQKKLGSLNLKNYPHFNFLQLFYWTFIKKIKSVAILNFIDYNKEAAMDVLQKKLNWKYYGGKHYESIYTRFYQGYILPKKFNIDKRRAHLSGLILSGQATRDQSLIDIKTNPLDLNVEKTDKDFVMKKLNYSEVEFNTMMNAPLKTFNDYPNNHNLVMRIKNIVNLMRKNGLYSK